MTDPHQTPNLGLAFAAWDQKDREHARLAAEVLPANKAALFDALAAAGITAVTVVFDGSDDSGQVENIIAEADNKIVALPAERIEIAFPVWGKSELERQVQPVGEAIETLAYALLGQTHEGWEINDGAFGEFVFDVADRTIALDFNERYSASENYTHEF